MGSSSLVGEGFGRNGVPLPCSGALSAGRPGNRPPALTVRGRPGEFLEGQDAPDSIRRDVARAVPKALAVAAEPGPRHVDFENHRAFDPAAVPLDDVQDRPPAARRRAGPDDGQPAARVAGEQAEPQDAVEVAGGVAWRSNMGCALLSGAGVGAPAWRG